MGGGVVPVGGIHHSRLSHIHDGDTMPFVSSIRLETLCWCGRGISDGSANTVPFFQPYFAESNASYSVTTLARMLEALLLWACFLLCPLYLKPNRGVYCLFDWALVQRRRYKAMIFTRRHLENRTVVNRAYLSSVCHGPRATTSSSNRV